MRKRFANKVKNVQQHNYYQKRVNESDFKGYVSYLKMKKV